MLYLVCLREPCASSVQLLGLLLFGFMYFYLPQSSAYHTFATCMLQYAETFGFIKQLRTREFGVLTPQTIGLSD
jgi:hypothetical protein